jgi:LPS sulfotransferase NodH
MINAECCRCLAGDFSPCVPYIQGLVHLIGAHNAAWQEWFESAGIEPYPVHHAQLAADPACPSYLIDRCW